MSLRHSGANRQSRMAKASSLIHRHPTTAPAIPVPLQIPGLALWLDAQAGPLPDGTEVPIAPDRSGQGRHCSASRGTPVYRPTGLHGRAALECDGTTEYDLTGPSLVLSDDLAVIAAVATPDNSSFYALKAGNTHLLVYLANSVFNRDDSNANNYQPFSGSMETGCLLRWYRTAGSWSFRATGQAEVSFTGIDGPLSVSSLVHDSSLGGSAFIGEVLIYSSGVNGTDRANLETYLSSRWNLSL